MSDQPMRNEVSVLIQHPHGLHARPASIFVKIARQFVERSKTRINVCNETTRRGPVDASSILGILTLGVNQGHTICVQAEGPEADQALAALQQLVVSNFGETIAGIE
ncbi:MAG: HPr family phosphocarrier protein [Proteobacteria bacterium]|nr:HPr family phosphocarrier protein [Pseudomonadota bacterium]